MSAGRATAADAFRSDINGLRAIAIAAVVAFHLAKGVAPGGFVGVDVFFVISGYLMTTIVVGRLEAGRFRLGGFYLARLRRIAPPLVALCAGLWLFGALLIDPWNFEGLAGKLPSALLFVSNFTSANGGGYFAESPNNNWFLHTWSLSVEWQFYLLYPLVLIALFAWPPARRQLWWVLVALAPLSFALAVSLGPRGWTWDFYMLPTRAWELLAGALCAGVERRLRPGPAWRAALHIAGLGLIAVGVAMSRPDGHWPSWPTLAPVGGTALVILAGLRTTWWAENPLVAGIGRASYSIYLWHWPVVVWLNDGHVAITWPVALGALAAMLALGGASYWLVERRLTDWVFQPKRGRAVLGAASVVVVLAVALAASATHGFEAVRTLREPPQVAGALADDRRAADDWAFPAVCGRYHEEGRVRVCTLGDPAARQVLLIGDSQAEQLAPRYAHAFDGRAGAGITLMSLPGCLPIPGVSTTRTPYCGQAWQTAYRQAGAGGFPRIVIAAAWSVYFDPSASTPSGLTELDDGSSPASRDGLADVEFGHLADAIRLLRAHGAQVVVIGATPRSDANEPHALYARTFWRGAVIEAAQTRSQHEASDAFVRRRLAALSQVTGATLLDPLDGLCVQQTCPDLEAGRTLYKDSGHFRASVMTQPRFAYLDPWLLPPAQVALRAGPTRAP